MPQVKHALVGLDLNSSRARAVAGSADAPPQTLPLDAPFEELPAWLNLEGRKVEVGRSGAAVCRRLPHLAVSGFLAQLGGRKRWSGDFQALDASDATRLLLGRLRAAFPEAAGVTLTTPAYLDAVQDAMVRGLSGEARLPLLATVAAPLAAAMAAHAEQSWSGAAFVLDADDHALTWTAVLAEGDAARLLGTQTRPELGLRAWKTRLLNCLADRCVRQSRRDPRDSADADQSLYDQLDDVLTLCRAGRPFEVAVRSPTWFQNLNVQPEELTAFCAGLVRQTLEAMRALQTTAGMPGAVLVTAAAGRLPGLTGALEEAVRPSGPKPEPSADWGEDLIDTALESSGPLHVLGEEAVARAAHDLAARIDRGEMAAGPVELAPLPPPQPVDAGLPRLHFHGQDYVLCGLSFQLGRHPQCDLVFDSDLYPTVSARHCEIVFERRQYVLRDRSKHGTLINDRPVVQEMVLHPGDWIRLGPHGPLLRFLGQPADQKKRMTTA